MGTIRLPFNELAESLGATHHWPMTGPDPTNTEVLGGSTDLDLSTMNTFTPEHGALPPKGATPYASTTGNGWALTVNGLPTHFTNAGLSEYTLLLFYRALGTPPYDAMDFDGAGSIGTNNPASGFNLYAFKVHSDGTYQRHHNDQSGTRSSATVDPATQGVGNGLLSTDFADDVLVGHVLYFPSALSAEDLTLLYDQRLFEAKISGTATVDGNGAEATIRAYTRTGGHLAGKTTAAADGTYDLWVVEPDKIDVLTTPPDGVDARPLVHGPITPIAA